MSTATLSRMYGINHHALHVNVKGVTNEEAWIQPRPYGNCMNWVVGHIVASRNGILAALGEEAIWPKEEAKTYARHSAPITAPGEGKPLDLMLADFDRAQERINSALGRITAADLVKPFGDGDTVGGWLHFLQFHEAYHIGQAGLLRRMAGKECAIP